MKLSAIKQYTLCLLILSLAISASAGNVLNIRRSITVIDAAVFLKDIVAPKTPLPENWGSRKVLTAPAPGESIDIPLTDVGYALQQYKDMSDISLRGDLVISVQRDGIPIKLDEFEDAIRNFIQGHPEWEGCTVQIDCEYPRDSILAPLKGTYDIQIDDYKLESKSKDFYTFICSLFINDEYERTFEMKAVVLSLKPFLVAAENLDRGTQLTDHHITTKLLPVKYESRGYIPASEKIDGLQIERSLRANQPFAVHMLEQPVCARRGEWVMVTAEKGALRISLRAKALSNGRLGDNILCINEQSKRRLLVHLTGSRQAEIDI